MRKRGIRRQFILNSGAYPSPFAAFAVLGMTGLVVKQIDFGAGIVHHDQIIESIAVEVSRMQEGDLAVDWKNLGTGKAKAVGKVVRRGDGSEDGSGNEQCARAEWSVQ